MYDVADKSSDWWFARLARDTKADGAVGRQGWVPGSFLDKFTSELSPEEEAAYMAGMQHPHWIDTICEETQESWKIVQ